MTATTTAAGDCTTREIILGEDGAGACSDNHATVPTSSPNHPYDTMIDPRLEDVIQDGADTVEQGREEEALAYLNPRLG